MKVGYTSAKQSDYDKYLAEKHASLNTSEEIIDSIVKETTGLLPSTKKKLLAGEVNEVYEITLPNGNKVITRISHNDNPEFKQEQWAIEKCKRLDVPVPEILLIKSITTNDQLLSFCIEQKIEGDTMERGSIDYHILDKDQFKKIIIEAGRILSRFHTIPTKDWGWINEEGRGIFKTPKDMVMEKVNQQDELVELAKETGFNPQDMDKIVKILQSHLYLYKGVQPKLNHGDYGPKHIMVKEGKITGILDFGGVCSDSPVYDFAWWDYWFGDDIPLEWLKEGYEDKTLFDERFDDLLHYIRLYRGIGTLYWYSKEKFQPAVDRAKQKLLEDLKYFY